MAVIEKRGPLQWRARIRLKGIEESTTHTSKAAAEAWAAETETSVRRGTWRDTKPAQKAFVDFARKYLDEVTPTKKSASREASRINLLIAAKEFRRPIGTIQAAHVAAYRDRRLKEPVHPSRRQTSNATRSSVSSQTVLHELNTLSAIWEC